MRPRSIAFCVSLVAPCCEDPNSHSLPRGQTFEQVLSSGNTRAQFAALERAQFSCDPGGHPPPEGCVRRVYDEFRRRTNLTARLPLSPPFHELQLFSVPDGTDAGVLLVITSASNVGWRYLHCHRFDLLAGADPVTLPPAGHHGEPVSGSDVTEEDIEVSIGLPELDQLAGAPTVRGRICNDVFALTPEQLATLRGYSERYREIATRRTAGDAGSSADTAGAP